MSSKTALALALAAVSALPLLAPPAAAAQESVAAPVRGYDPAGRRDPFKNLLGGAEVKERRTSSGPADLMVEDLQIVGVIKSKSGYKAIIAMTDGFPLTVREGEAFGDGYVLSIREGQVVFRKTKERGLPLRKPRDVVRDINSEER